MRGKDPLVTVVIPTHRRPSLLSRAVASALEQTFRDLEIIVVIDGDDAPTVSALAGFDDSRLRYIVSPKVGATEARNIGVRAGRGDWVALLDDDDEWLPGKLQRQMDIAESAGNKQLLVTCFYLCQAEGMPDVIRPRRLPRNNEPVSEYMFDLLCYFQTSTFLCPRELLLRVPFDRDAAFFQDIDWVLRLSKLSGFQLLVVPEPLCMYRMPSALPGITSALGWRSRLDWGHQRRHLMSKRAYSRFIVGTCMGRAVKEKGGMEAFKELMYHTTVLGSPTPYLVLLLCLGFLLSPEQRKRVRDVVYLKRPTSRPAILPKERS